MPRAVKSPVSDQAAPNNALEGLDNLLAAREEFDDEFVHPTEYAVAAARAIISSTYGRFPDLRALKPLFSTIGDGSVHVRWRSGDCEVRVLIPPGSAIPVRLYHRRGEEDGVESTVTPEKLARRLNSLIRE
jgi:hypothetical protein